MPYVDHIERIQRSGLFESVLRGFFQAPQELFLTQVAIPLNDAKEATQPITDEVRKEISEGFKNYEIEWDNVPVFPAR